MGKGPAFAGRKWSVMGITPVKACVDITCRYPQGSDSPGPGSFRRPLGGFPPIAVALSLVDIGRIGPVFHSSRPNDEP